VLWDCSYDNVKDKIAKLGPSLAERRKQKVNPDKSHNKLFGIERFQAKRQKATVAKVDETVNRKDIGDFRLI
jgi:hypothetical protein